MSGTMPENSKILTLNSFPHASLCSLSSSMEQVDAVSRAFMLNSCCIAITVSAIQLVSQDSFFLLA